MNALCNTIVTAEEQARDEEVRAVREAKDVDEDIAHDRDGGEPGPGMGTFAQQIALRSNKGKVPSHLHRLGHLFCSLILISPGTPATASD
jgi:hypothetical protein